MSKCVCVFVCGKKSFQSLADDLLNYVDVVIVAAAAEQVLKMEQRRK